MMRRPNTLPWFHRWRTNLIQVPLMAVSTIICGSLSLLSSLVDRSGRVQHRIAHIWAKTLVWCTGCPLTVLGAENLRKYPVVVFTANHTSYMDTPVIFAALHCQFRILAMKKLWPVPIIGWWLNRSGQIPVDMTNPGATLSSLGAAIKALRSGMPLFIFPEGGRTTDGALQPFLSGAAYLAIRAQVPVVPIALSGVFDLLPPHARHFYPGALTMSVGEPIETVGMSLRQMDELTEQVKSAIASMLEDHIGTANLADLEALDNTQSESIEPM
jgi:1-acyl-sn-glycerol-3-phosphate acyltransferase